MWPSGGGITAGGPNSCDFSDPVAIYPTTTLHTVFARLNQRLSGGVRFDVTALYANRSIEQIGGTLGTGALGTGAAGQATLAASSPFYRPTGDANDGLPQVVRYDYSPLFGTASSTQNTDLETWRVAPRSRSSWAPIGNSAGCSAMALPRRRSRMRRSARRHSLPLWPGGR
ncbi:hypothetical protein [Novosphingobium sp. ST904]|uniref:hypothetical protein n=1 Tax=Novosphingobium sp. ST904 TaxID=1684385 RepID=UPI0006C842B9|nr:hypothetical protein [Novosphingobium sp. ST904]KPH59548.1 hypothetical protein ADT71_22385 [Novosphingobium sp. ST904]